MGHETVRTNRIRDAKRAPTHQTRRPGDPVEYWSTYPIWGRNLQKLEQDRGGQTRASPACCDRQCPTNRICRRNRLTTLGQSDDAATTIPRNGATRDRTRQDTCDGVDDCYTILITHTIRVYVPAHLRSTTYSAAGELVFGTWYSDILYWSFRCLGLYNFHRRWCETWMRP